MAERFDSGPVMGVVTDTSPYELPPGVWSIGYNVSFKNNKTSQRGGSVEVLYTYDTAVADPSPANTGNGVLTVASTTSETVAEVITCTATSATEFTVVGSVSGSLGTATVDEAFTSSVITFTIPAGGTPFVAGDNFTVTITKVSPAATPKFCMPWSTTTNDYWVWATNSKAYRWDGSAHDDYTRTTGGDYTATDTNQWTGCVYGDVAILNNREDLPQYLGSSGTSFENFPTTGSNWPSTLRCRSLRAYKSYLVAINLTEGASIRPMSFRWSTAADPGSLPLWDITDTTLECGESVLADTDGELVDGMSLGDSFFLYKEDSVYGMQLVGGQYVMQVYKLFDDDGILGVNCVTQFPGHHFVASSTDVYIHNGSQKRSVISGKARETLYSIIDRSKLNRAYCVTDYRNRECLFCFVAQAFDTTYPNMAMVYNWENDTVSVRNLHNSPFIASGTVVEASAEGTVWEEDSTTWESDTTTWDSSVLDTEDKRLVMIDGDNTRFLAEGPYSTDAGTDIECLVERTGITAGDDTLVKYVTRLYPSLTGTADLSFYIGGEDIPNGGVAWKGPYTFTIGTSRKVDCRVSGRYLGVRVYTIGAANWSLSRYWLEGQGVGDGAT